MTMYRVYSGRQIVVETPDRSVALRSWSNASSGGDETVSIYRGDERMARLVRLSDGRVHQRIDL